MDVEPYSRNMDPFITGEGAVAGTDFPGYWYWVSIPHKILPTMFGDELYTDNNIDEIIRWCSQQFGIPQAPGHRIQRRWHRTGLFATFHFREKKDRDWFILRWT